MPMPDYLFLGIPAFLHLHMIFQHLKANLNISSRVRTCTESPFPPSYSFVNAGMPDCPAFSQSSTGMKKNADAGTMVGIRASFLM
jgi:hypothetical protein